MPKEINGAEGKHWQKENNNLEILILWGGEQTAIENKPCWGALAIWANRFQTVFRKNQDNVSDKHVHMCIYTEMWVSVKCLY